MPKRPDAELVPNISKFRELEFHIMHGRNESVIFFEQQVDLTKTFAYIEKYNEGKELKDQLTLFQIFLCAGVRTVTLRHHLNRFVSGRRLWQRNQILFSFVVKKEKTEEGEEVNAMIEFDPFDNLNSVRKKVDAHLYEARHGENKNEKDIKFFGSLPRWLIKLIFWFARWRDEKNHPIYSITKDLPLYATAFIAHLGSLGIKAVFHHLFELGNVSFFVTIGKIHKAAVVNQETEEIEIKKVMKLKISIDDRISEGIYLGHVIDLLTSFIENPERLEDSPKLTDEQLDKLMLKKYKDDRLERERERKKK